TEQFNYIKNYFNEVEKRIYSYDFTDPEKGYRALFDIDSFVGHILTNELCGNHDQCWSIYCYKKRNDPKLYFGPVWDFDLGFDNDNRCYPVCERTKYSTYLFTSAGSDAGGVTRRMVRRIFIDDPATRNDISRIWSIAVNDRGLNIESLQQFIRHQAELIQDAQRLNFMRWPILDQRVHENPRDEPTFEIAVNNVLDFIEERYTQLHGKLGYDPNISGISNIALDTASKLYVDGRAVCSSDPEQAFAVYNLQGVKIFEGKTASTPLSPGLYIGKSDGNSVKLLVR
ncbi:MAG: CotH kinase family protein, partial [Muribaculaceae bacterium]|nr:CotH kinase family protein [Muribaculaceae bacterium]